MKAAVYEGQHTLNLHECKPRSPGSHEVRLEIAYCGICGSDLHILEGTEDKRMHLPSIIGHECSAVVAEIGKDVANLSVGDHVVVTPVKACGHCNACKSGFSHVCENLQVRGIEVEGAFQYSWTVDADAVIKIPDSLSLKHAALAEPLSICCHVVKRGNVKTDDFVVVIGGLEKAHNLGIDAINPMEIDIKQYVMKKTHGVGADVVFETSGSQAGVDVMVELPKVRGRIVLVAIYGRPMVVNLKQMYYFEKEMITARMQELEDFEKAIELLTQKAFDPEGIITSVLPLTSIHEGFKRCSNRNGSEVKVIIDCHIN